MSTSSSSPAAASSPMNCSARHGPSRVTAASPSNLSHRTWRVTAQSDKRNGPHGAARSISNPPARRTSTTRPPWSPPTSNPCLPTAPDRQRRHQPDRGLDVSHPPKCAPAVRRRVTRCNSAGRSSNLRPLGLSYAPGVFPCPQGLKSAGQPPSDIWPVPPHRTDPGRFHRVLFPNSFPNEPACGPLSSQVILDLGLPYQLSHRPEDRAEIMPFTVTCCYTLVR